MDEKEPLQRLKIIAAEMRDLYPKNEEEEGLLGYLVGAAFALREAIKYDFPQTPTRDLPANDYADRLRGVALKLFNESEIDNVEWLSRFHYNSALLRLSALTERTSTYARERQGRAADARRRERSRSERKDSEYVRTMPDIAPDVRKRVIRDVDWMKHQVVGLLHGRTAQLTDAISLLEGLVRSLARFMSAASLPTQD